MTEAMSKPNRTARRRERTRRQLLDAMEAVVLKHGYEEASADAVSEWADLGRSTFYNHFDNKQDAVLAMLTRHYHDYGDAAYVPLEETPDRASSLARSALRVFRAMAADPLTRQLVDRPRLLAQAIAESQGEFIVRDLTEGVMQGRFSFVIPPERLATMLNWSYVGMLINAVNDDEIEETARDWVRFVLVNLGIAAAEADELVAALPEE
ncbi:MAG: TetR/AcrR family transcriptional regulator [Pseudomonadota bacterium]